MSKPLILASASPRRRELLGSAGVLFSISAADIDEAVLPGESSESMVLRLANEKALHVAKKDPQAWVLAADTTVVIFDTAGKETNLGKPESKEEAILMLSSLSGRTHTVFTGVSLVNLEQKVQQAFTCRSEVTIRSLSKETIEAYAETGEPMDKAGGYAVQGIGASFIQSISGSYTNVVGLPLSEVISLLEKFSLWTPNCMKKHFT